MDLQELVAVIRSRWRPIVVLTMLGTLIAWGFTSVQERMYTAQVTVLVSPAAASNTGELNSGASLVERVVQTYAELARTPVVLTPVANDLHLGSVSELRSAVATSIPGGTTFISIQVTWNSADTAANAANAIGSQLAIAVKDLAPTQGGRASVVVDTIAPAVAPSAPSAPDVATNVSLGLLVGLIVGIGYVLLRAALDSRIRSVKDVHRVTNVPVLGTITGQRGRVGRRARGTIADSDEWSEDYRRVRTNLRLLHVEHPTGVLVVTSCTADEGTTAFAVNLARTSAEGGLRVCLIDADLRTRDLRQMLQLSEGPGLAEVLMGKTDLETATQVVYGIDVIDAGGETWNPGDLVSSPMMSKILRSVTDQHDLVICVAAPLGSASDGAALGSSADGVVLVVGSKRLTTSQFSDSTESLEMAGARLLGVVLNDTQDLHAVPGSV